MSSGSESRSSLERFFDNFFQEKNIRWMLGIGVMILFGSSVMLVTQHWGDMTPFWKCLVVMGYTAVVYGASELTYRRLGLRTTGTVLKALTLLLIPVSFLSLNWLSSGSGTIVNLMSIGFAAMLLLHGIFSTYASRNILRHFLRADQPTLLISYLALCFAGAIVPAVGPDYPMLTSVVLWAMFAAGSVKSARHVFWLTEDHKLPRIFGFFPILLLGIQFGLLFGFGCAAHLSLDWLGFGCALIAIPILFTSDAFADVHEQRTGGLIRPLPLGIIMPLGLGTALLPIGMALAATGLPTAYALVPSAVLAAVMMAVVARRTGHPGFAWAMVACVTMAYKFCPVYFSELAMMLRDSAAHSLNEDKLPLAFYGLTCLPLLLTAVLSGRWFKQRGDQLFGSVLPQFAIGGSIFLTAIAITHVKAAFLVPAVMVGWFVFMAVYLADRRLLIPATASLVMASWTAVAFLESVVGVACGIDAAWIAVTTASLLLLVASRWTDGDWLPIPNGKFGGLWSALLQTRDGVARPFGKSVSAVVSIAAAVAWMSQNLVANNASVTGWLLITGTLVVQTLVCRSRYLATFSIAFGMAGGILFGIHSSIATLDMIRYVNLSGFGLWIAGSLLAHQSNRVADCFTQPLRQIGCLVLLSFLLLWQGPFLAVASVWLPRPLMALDILLAAASVAWTFHSAIRMQFRGLSVIGILLALPLMSAVLSLLIQDRSLIAWYALYWSAALGAVLPAINVVARAFKSDDARLHRFECYVAGPVTITAHVLLTLLVIVSLPFWGGKLSAGLIALAGIALMEKSPRTWQGLPAVCMANWYGLAVLLHQCIVHPLFPAANQVQLATIGFVMAAATALSALFFRLPVINRLHGVREVCEHHRALLHGATIVAMFATLTMFGNPMNAALVGLVVLIAAIVVTDLLVSAISLQSETLVWGSLLTGAATVVYLTLFGVISIHFGILSYGLLAAASTFYLLARALRGSDRWKILCRPLRLTACVLPVATLPLAIGSALTGKSATWLGGDSQALLLAGAFYFWTGLQSKSRGLIVLATIFVNVSLMLLWHDLHWYDPQLFMIPMGISVIGLVQLLKREIPGSLLNPLRYAGALMILVSPTFHIIGGSWLHLFSLMAFSVLVILAAIGLRLRALVYTGTAFLAADLIAMVFRGSFDNPNLLWLAGLALGASVIGLAAFFEGKREKILDRVRVLAATLETWQ